MYITKKKTQKNGVKKNLTANEEEKNEVFLQLIQDADSETLTRLTKKSPTSISVLMFLWNNMDGSHAIMVSQSVIAEALNKSRQTIGNAIKILEEEKIIGIGKVGQANVYFIHPQATWRNGLRQENIMNFSGNVLLGKAENQALFHQFDSD